MTPPPVAWELEERTTAGAWAELRRLARRSRRRPFLTLFLTLLMTGAAVGQRSRKPRVYEARVALRVTESDLDADTAPRTVGNLRNYVAEVCFSESRLARVIKQYGLYPAQMKRDERQAVEEMRDDLDVEVWRNFFALPRSPDDPGRTARMAITFHGKDRYVVYQVTHALAQLVLEEEETSRLAQAEGALTDADERVKQARALAQERHRQLVEKQVQHASAHNEEQSARLLIETQSMIKLAKAADEQVLTTEKARQTLWMRLQLERKQMGLQFELIDGGRVPPAGPSKRFVLAVVAVLVFCFTLPLAMLGVGALDPRVYEAEDIRRLGLTALGELPRFGGDNRGTLEERLAAERRRPVRDGS
jgi:hypothetical protein